MWRDCFIPEPITEMGTYTRPVQDWATNIPPGRVEELVRPHTSLRSYRQLIVNEGGIVLCGVAPDKCHLLK